MKGKKINIFLAVTMVFLLTLSACSGTSTPTATPASTPKPTTAAPSSAPVATPTPAPVGPLKLSIMLPYGTYEHDNKPETIRYQADLNRLLDAEIEWIWFDLAMYYENLVLVFASGNLPTLLTTGKSAEFINAVNNDTFWEVGDLIADYKNLSVIPDATFSNASINGHLYGIPRSRDLARNGVGYRLDWLENLGLKEPTTLDEFYDMLYAFTYNDPDQNGLNDTVGLGITSYAGTWNIMQLWFGSPNGWGLDSKGDLVPDYLTAEYDNALRWFRKIYSEGLVNQDFRDYDPGQWDAGLLRSGIAGASADVLDRFRRNQNYFNTEGIPASTNLVGAIDAGYGIRVMPTSGYNEMIVISKQKSPTVDDLKRVLTFMDRLSDAEVIDLINYGYEGTEYRLDENGCVVRYTAAEKEALGIATYDYRSGYNQLPSWFISPEEQAKRLTDPPITFDTQILERKLLQENIPYCVPNLGASYTSPTFVASGADLDAIINNARLDFITGVIDEVGLQAAKEQWKRSGGNDVLKEMNELYHANN